MLQVLEFQPRGLRSLPLILSTPISLASLLFPVLDSVITGLSHFLGNPLGPCTEDSG